jgi:predicted DNA-binding transcriptional regulator
MIRSLANADTEDRMSRIEQVVKGPTLRVYALLLTRDQLGVRDVQRTLGFSSPSVALHHLKKLVELDLVKQLPEGEYYAAEHMPIGILSVFVRIGGVLLPRLIFLMSFGIIMLVLYLFFVMSGPIGTEDVMFISVVIVFVLMLARESKFLYQLRPC